MSLGDEIVSPALQKELDQKIADAGGDIQAVRHELEDQLHELEKQQEASDDPESFRPHIALLLAEIEYLDKKALEAKQTVVEKHEGLLDRIREWLAGSKEK